MSGQSVNSLAAVFFETSEEINTVMAAFAAQLEARGKHLAGIIQVSANTPGAPCAETHVRDLASGARIPILQKLGPQSQACRADGAALADAAALIRQALAADPDIIFINRFGRLETEGKGMREEIGAAAASGIPVVIGVAQSYRDAWREFAQGLGAELPCTLAALEAWWQQTAAR